jgi:hypothetical protein
MGRLLLVAAALLRILPGSGQQIVAVTSDDWLVYITASYGASAISLAGSSPRVITTDHTLFSGIFLYGRTVFASSNADINQNGDLHVWTSAGASVKLNRKGSSRIGMNCASDDGRYVLYSDGATTTTTDLYLARVDGTGAKRVLSGVRVDPDGCYSMVAFAGDRFLVAHCDGAATSATITAIDPASGATRDLRSGARPYVSHDKTGKRLFTVDAAPPGAAWLTGIDGSNPTKIDTNVFYGFPLRDGGAVIYGTNAPAMKLAMVPGPAQWILTGTHFAGFMHVYSPAGANPAVSPDERYAITASMMGGGISDLYLTSLTAPGAPVELWKRPTGCLVTDAFTTASTHVLYYAPCTNVKGLVTGTLRAMAVGGGAPFTLGERAWNDLATSRPTTIVFNDGWTPRENSNGRADLRVVDVAAAKPSSTLIAARVEADFALDAARDRIVWSDSAGASPGIYIAPVP